MRQGKLFRSRSARGNFCCSCPCQGNISKGIIISIIITIIIIIINTIIIIIIIVIIIIIIIIYSAE